MAGVQHIIIHIGLGRVECIPARYRLILTVPVFVVHVCIYVLYSVACMRSCYVQSHSDESCSS